MLSGWRDFGADCCGFLFVSSACCSISHYLEDVALQLLKCMDLAVNEAFGSKKGAFGFQALNLI
jgi:hypothetical protein